MSQNATIKSLNFSDKILRKDPQKAETPFTTDNDKEYHKNDDRHSERKFTEAVSELSNRSIVLPNMKGLHHHLRKKNNSPQYGQVNDQKYLSKDSGIQSERTPKPAQTPAKR